jgi:epoxyqueuosine reductase
MDIQQLTLQIKEEAFRLGFILAGITSPDPPERLDVFQDWIGKGYQASMDWIGTSRSLERRSDPLKILPKCKSILVLAAPHPAPQGNLKGGNISSYALNQDYHDVLAVRLKKLIKSIENLSGRPVSNRWYVDTGPVLEKELAMRAGLGWIGKNTLLINRSHGSYFFLAEILLDIRLINDPLNIETFCGSCTNCLDTCPTGALREPYVLDANRCISYLTIEHNGNIPKEIRPKMGDWIFGCDICQIVCPWNKPGAEALEILDEFHPRAELQNLQLEDELGLSTDGFNTRFKASPIKRSKRRGYLRNVSVALGNQKNAAALPALMKALEDQEPLVRIHAAWALGEIGGKETITFLNQRLKEEADPNVINAARDAIIRINIRSNNNDQTI